MAGHPARDRLSGTAAGFVPGWAGRADDAALRRLLRETPMDGQIRISLEREPDFFRAAAVDGHRHHTGVARDMASGEVAAMCTRSVREVWLNGERCHLGYLGQLRIATDRIAVSRALLRCGFETLRSSHRTDEAAFDISTIVADNTAARRLLEHGLPGLPRYRALESLVTFLVPVRRRHGVRAHHGERGHAALAPQILACLDRYARRHQFAPYWSARNMCPPGLDWGDFHVVRDGDVVVGCIARWDLRGFKQAVIRGYAPAVGRIRGLLNLLGARLPALGETLPLVFLSHLAVDGDDGAICTELLRAARAAASAGGCDWLALGLAARHPLAPWVRRAFRPREYESILYAVHDPGTLAALDGRVPHLEVAVL